MKPSGKRKKHKYIFVVIGIVSCFISLVFVWTRSHYKEELTGLSRDTTWQADLKKISFLSGSGIFRYSNIENSLEAYYQHQEFYEAMSRAMNSIDRDCGRYQIEEAQLSAEEVHEQFDGHFVLMEFASGHSIDFSVNPNLKMTQMKCLLYNAQNGDFWFGKDAHSLTCYARFDDTNGSYTQDKNFLTIIEGGKESKASNVWEGALEIVK